MKSGGSPLRRDWSAERALAALLTQTSTAIERNALVMMLSEDPEGAHQFRVALRRMRAVLKTARPLLSRGAVRPIEDWARDLGRAASIWRDADVVIDDVVAPALEAGAAPNGGGALRKALEAARKTARDNARAALREIGTANFLEALSALIATRGWRLDPTDGPTSKAGRAQGKKLERPARRLAELALERAWGPAAEWGDRLESLTIEERHEMRKALKTLRYAVEAYAPLYVDQPDRTERFVKELRRLQNVFGYLNDVAMAESLVDDASGARRAATAAILAWHADRAETAWEKARRRWSALAATPRFW